MTGENTQKVLRTQLHTVEDKCPEKGSTRGHGDRKARGSILSILIPDPRGAPAAGLVNHKQAMVVLQMKDREPHIGVLKHQVMFSGYQRGSIW